jgi:hypothetical protein
MPDWTPGPWEVFRFGPGLEVKTIYGYSGMDRSQLIPAVVSPGVNAEANARLIAASPDLLEALEFLISAAEECMLLTGEGTLSEADEVILDIARAAVAQAKGGTPC